MISLAADWRLYLGVAAAISLMPMKTDYVEIGRRDSERIVGYTEAIANP
jgi:hypothetical protein